MNKLICEDFHSRILVQIFINEESVTLRKIEKNNIASETKYYFEDLRAFYYVLSSIPQAKFQIIFSSEMSFKRIKLPKTDQKKLNSILEQRLEKLEDATNTSFFCCQASSLTNKNQEIMVNICDALLPDCIVSILNELFSKFNNIQTIIPRPSWLIQNYFTLFQNDLAKFSASIFVSDEKFCIEFTAISSKGEIECYRRCPKDAIDEKQELLNTMTYVSNLLKISAEDIAIYYINDQLTSSFILPINNSMSFVSKILTQKDLSFSHFEKPIKIALRSICFLFFVAFVFDLVGIYEKNSIITEEEKAISLIPEELLQEKEIWKNIPKEEIKRINYQKKLAEVANIIKDNLLSSINIERKGEKIEMRLRPLNSDPEDYFKGKKKIGELEIENQDGEIIAFENIF